MSTALQIHTPPANTGRSPSAAGDFLGMMELARELVPTGFLPEHIKTPGQAVAIILQGRELGMEPMRALRSLTMVKGKVVENADSQLARFKDEGGRTQFLELSETCATLALKHPNGDEHTESFTITDANAAGLTKPGSKGEPSMYTKYPKAMLRSRVITAGLKSVGWSGAVGNYDPEEAVAFAPAAASAALAAVSSSTEHETSSATGAVATGAVATGATGSPAATEYQVKKILELCDHTAIDEALATKTRARVKAGVTTAFADRIRVGLETEIKKATPSPLPVKPLPVKPVAAEPTVEQLQAAAESASIDELARRYKALMASDRIAPNVQDRVQAHIATLELTPDVLRSAIAELEDGEIPF